MKIHNVEQFINSTSEFFTILNKLPSIGTDGPWVAGGSVWKTIEQIPLTCDVDIFFKNAQQCELWYRTLLSIPYGNRIVSQAKSNSFNTTLKYHVHSGNYNKTISLQLISFKFFENIGSLLDSFDFTACQFGFDGQKLYTGDTSLDDVRNREIIFHSVSTPSATLNHLKKYEALGFKIPECQRVKFQEMTGKSINKPIPSVTGESTFDELIEPVLLTVGDGYDDDDENYPAPTNNTGINLSSITDNILGTMPARNTGISEEFVIHQNRPVTSMWDNVSVRVNDSFVTSNPCAEIPIPMERNLSVEFTPTAIPMDYIYLEGNTTSPSEII